MIPYDKDEFIDELLLNSPDSGAPNQISMDAPPQKAVSSEVADFLKYKSLVGDDQEKLDRAREEEREANSKINMSQALSELGSSLAGAKGDTKFFDALRKDSDDRVKGVESDMERNRKLVSDYLQNKRMEEAHKDSMDFKRLVAGETKRKENEKKEKELEELTTPFGVARTADDAKQLKAASELKAKFDRGLDEMIQLRKKHGGGAILNRNDVERGKQLANDLLLAYKDLSNLGVLSKYDEKIIKAVIPNDPLEYDLVPGQDPILHRMEKFKGDSKADFETRMRTRLRGAPASSTVSPPSFPMKVRNGSKTAVVKDEKELAEANAKGFK